MNTLARTKETLKVGSLEVARAAGAIAVAGLFFAPHGVNHALKTTEVTTTVAGLPADLGFYPGATRVDGLNQARVYIDQTVAGIGVDAKVTGLPRFENAQQVSDLISPERLGVYTSLADSPEEAIEGYVNILQADFTSRFVEHMSERSVPYGLALYGGLGMLRLNHRLRQAEGTRAGFEPTPLYMTGLATVAIASSFAVADENHRQWQATGGIPDGLSTIESLEGTSLEGAKMDNPVMERTLNIAVRYGLGLKDRREADRQTFLAAAEPNLATALETLSEPGEDEQLLVFISDMHAGKAGSYLAKAMVDNVQQRFGTDKVAHVFNLGDTLYDPGLQGSSLDDQAAIMEQGVHVLTPGNHDVDDTAELAKNAGMIVPEGRQTIEGIDVYSVSDPEQTPFLQGTSLIDPSVTHATIGEEAYLQTSDERVDLVNFHDPAAVLALVDVPSRAELTTEGSLTTCEDNDDFRDINASMVSAGHSHKQYPINMDCNSDGTWFVANLQGTGGGAEESPTFNNWSDPDGAPIKTISFRVFYRNTTYGSITGYADVEIRTDGSVEPVFRNSIGTPDGAPFDMTESDASQIDKRAPQENQ